MTTTSSSNYTTAGTQFAWPNTCDPFSWLLMLTAPMKALEYHNHTAGKGLQVGAGGLEADTVDTAQLVDDAVTTDKIAADAVTIDQIAADAVDTDQLVDDAVTIDKMADASVGIDQLTDQAVDIDKLSYGVPGLSARQGGSATDWSAGGTSTYTPQLVRMQIGVVSDAMASSHTDVTVTFPVAFSDKPVVQVSLGTDTNTVIVGQHDVTATNFKLHLQIPTLGGLEGVISTPTPVVATWLAIGPIAA